MNTFSAIVTVSSPILSSWKEAWLDKEMKDSTYICTKFAIYIQDNDIKIPSVYVFLEQKKEKKKEHEF